MCNMRYRNNRSAFLHTRMIEQQWRQADCIIYSLLLNIVYTIVSMILFFKCLVNSVNERDLDLLNS